MDVPPLTGRRIVVTGASSGLGLAATRELARRGAAVVLAVRDVDKGAAVRRDLLADLPGADLDVQRLDLGDLDSVRAFAERVPADGRPVDALLNNAGIGGGPRALSPQGHELVFATNHLGHFALTGLLLPRLVTGTDPRVVTVSSGLYPLGRIDFADLTAATRYSQTRAYVGSKLANALFGLELERRLLAAGSPVRSLLAHPGVARTAMPTSAPSAGARAVGRLLGSLLGRSAEAGAAALVHAVAADLPGATMVGPGPRRGPFRPAVEPIRHPADDPDLARRLWEVSAELTGVHPAALTGPSA
ncbi:SDR family NAD(P)-dependent oxidoreductase [Pseudonocardia humida]|uniref:SDR family NAD(P)-dependent oxidoreductase n=1 Tax=Pseudonocardia humida TaxID=2800819 RepID=A0ABT1A0Q6_9PSEU|nr:SDR family NAD(P)-dependent oxidoreductase [Pseudonocardia humida]MCO1656582.1 SDR family NAD(P)-dependent oxidoreductase [Pseudonocardia humida]